MAINNNTLQDPDASGEYPDWIELYNAAGAAINLGNMYLTDDIDEPTKWRISQDISITANGFVIFYADDDTIQGKQHTNFRLNADGGIIALIDSDGKTIIDAINYCCQETDISYSRYPDGADAWYFNSDPTPNAQNTQGYLGQIADLQFSQTRGFYNQSMQVSISTATSGATIHYTLDGSAPGTRVSSTVFAYSQPIPIAKTTCLRVFAFKQGWKATDVITHTYIYLDDVIRQPARPSGFPLNWGHDGTGDFEMDPQVVDNPAYSGTIKDDLQTVPSLSLVMDVDDWFGRNGQGIYVEGELEERAVSAELFFPDDTEGFQINCAVMIVGGTSVDRWKMDKLSLRLKFKNDYGPSSLTYPLFGPNNAQTFNTLVVDARMNNSWAYGGSVSVVGRDLTQRDLAQYTRDQFVCDIQNTLGGYAPHGRHVQLYLNGLYWGLYWLHERPDAYFAASYLGGSPDDFDVLKHNSQTVVNGSDQVYQALLTLANQGLQSKDNYHLMEQFLDIPDFINYMLLNFYVGNVDWAHQNWYATRNKNSGNGKWRYHSWDAEHVMEGLHNNVTDKNDPGGPTYLHQKLKENKIYRILFADHVYKNFFNNGIFTADKIKSLYQLRLDEVNRAVVAESARWGDNQRAVPYTRDVEWVTERDWLMDTFFDQRAAIVVNQLRDLDLYPDADVPQFLINDIIAISGFVSRDDILTIKNESGTIYYTVNGEDPLYLGTISENARVYSQPIVISKSMHIKARNFDRGEWSPVNELRLIVPTYLEGLILSELHYHPQSEDTLDDRDFEFIELKNISDCALDLSAIAFVEGIAYIFPVDSYLEPNQFVVLAANSERFEQRYQFKPFGTFTGNLNNNGETITLVDSTADTLITLHYDDAPPWPTLADGAGYSLVIKNSAQINDYNNPGSWRVSHQIHGSPGQEDTTNGSDDIHNPILYYFYLYQNYPNPFNNQTTILYNLPEATNVHVSVYNIKGQLVIDLVNTLQPRGRHAVSWYGTNINGYQVASGIYICYLQAGGFVTARKLVLIR